jgi:hypothetical protein
MAYLETDYLTHLTVRRLAELNKTRARVQVHTPLSLILVILP